MKPFPLVFHRGLFLDRFYSLSRLGHWAVSLLNSQYLTTSTLIILSCIISFSADNTESSFYRLQQCLIFVQNWMTTDRLKLNPKLNLSSYIGHERQKIKYFFMFLVTPLGKETYRSKTAKISALCSMRSLIIIRAHISNVCKLSYTITSVTCAESENTWAWNKPGAWRLPLCQVGLTTATPCCMVSQLGTWSSSRE